MIVGPAAARLLCCGKGKSHKKNGKRHAEVQPLSPVVPPVTWALSQMVFFATLPLPNVHGSWVEQSTVAKTSRTLNLEFFYADGRVQGNLFCSQTVEYFKELIKSIVIIELLATNPINEEMSNSCVRLRPQTSQLSQWRQTAWDIPWREGLRNTEKQSHVEDMGANNPAHMYVLGQSQGDPLHMDIHVQVVRVDVAVEHWTSLFFTWTFVH